MGMLVNGAWVDADKHLVNGEFRRETRQVAKPLCLEPTPADMAQPRYWLIVSRSCPWSHGTTIVRSIRTLESHVGLQVTTGPRVQGYAANGGLPWRVPGTDRSIVHLHELYTMSDPAYTGRSTIPVLWDARDGRIVSNDSLAIIRGLNDLARGLGRGPDLVPEDLKTDINDLNARLYEQLGNAVYQAGFAEIQAAYDEAVERVFGMLDELEDRLSERKHLFGDRLTEADCRLFPTLVRFDNVYHVLHRCTRKRLTDYPALWTYARRVFAWPGVSDTVDFDEIMRGSYLNDTANNPHGIVPVVPALDWDATSDFPDLNSNLAQSVWERASR